MPECDFDLMAVARTLENETHLVEALFFPEVSRYGDDLARLCEAIKANAKRIVADSSLLDLHRRHACGTPSVSEATITLEGPPRSTTWTRPVSLVFHVLRWTQGEDAHIAFVPALGIEIVASSQKRLDSLIPAHIRFTLMRDESAKSLARLAQLERCTGVSVECLSFRANVQTPKQVAVAEDEEKQEDQGSVLERVATDLTSEPGGKAYETDDLVARIAEALVGRRPRSLLLVGPSGVGKTAAVRELVRRRKSFGLGRTPFWATSGSRLVAGMSGFGMWEERCGRFWREVSKERAIVHLGNLVELMQVGKSEHSQRGIAAFLRPYIGRGDILAVAECTSEQLPLIEREDPHLLGVFHQVKVDEPSPEKGKAILLSVGLSGKSQKKEEGVSIEAVETLDRLHRRYATYSAYPGRPLRSLRNLLRDRPKGTTLTPQDVTKAFSRETGLPLFMLDEAVPLDVGRTRQWFKERVIGQSEAVDLVVDLVTTAKAGLTRPRKPIASLLFIGPTGVGKTEMAKALAEFLYGDRTRMVRFDMSEFGDPQSVRRLSGGVFGREGLLTAKVREQPFGVILLDEFEKAHPLFFDLLLQIMGEGRLTDAGGRLADFTNSVVIMTSNLGAESFRQGRVGFGTDPGVRSDAREHFMNEVRRFLRPELFNRIDRVVPFAPLNEETVHKIAERELGLVRRRDGILLRELSLELPEDVPGYLAKKGYDPRYGARPLKRAIERELLVPLADAANTYSAELALSADVSVDKANEDGLRFHVRARTDGAGRPLRPSETDSELAGVTARCVDLRRRIQRLDRSPTAVKIENELYRAARVRARLGSRPWLEVRFRNLLRREPELKGVRSRMKALSSQVCSLEDKAMLAVLGKRPADTNSLGRALASAGDELRRLLLSVYALDFQQADHIVLGVYSEDRRLLFMLAEMYYGIAAGHGYRIAVRRALPPLSRRTTGAALRILPVEKPRRFLAVPSEDVIGIVLDVSGALACPRFEREQGLHVFKNKGRTARCLVDTSDAGVEDYRPPEGVDRRGGTSGHERRRTYDLQKKTAEDPVLERRLTWSGHDLGSALAEAIEEQLGKEARRQLMGE